MTTPVLLALIYAPEDLSELEDYLTGGQVCVECIGRYDKESEHIEFDGFQFEGIDDTQFDDFEHILEPLLVDEYRRQVDILLSRQEPVEKEY